MNKLVAIAAMKIRKKEMNFQGRLISKIVFRHPNLIILITIYFFLLGCQGLQVNVPVEVQQIRREDAALLVLVENKSSRLIKITYPISTGFLKQGQHTIFPFLKPGNYRVTITAYTEDLRYRDVYQPISTFEVPVFLNGYDTVRAKGNFVGHYLQVTDGMLLPNK